MTLTWPMALVVVAVIACVTLLGVRGIVTPTWIEHTLTALIGLTVGNVLARRGPSGPPGPPGPMGPRGAA